MTRLIDLTERRASPSLRHPEKAHRPDQPVARKPPWIRVRAPGSPVFAETMSLVREFCSRPSAGRRAVPISANAGTSGTPLS